MMARKEVILSAGGIKSPQILMMSGIGPQAHLQSKGINVVKDLPVGQNLENHVMVPISSKITARRRITALNLMII